MGDPIEIRVTYRNDDYVKELEQRLAAAEARANRAEYMYRCETLINTELQDLCKQHGIQYRAALQARPWEGEPSPAAAETPSPRGEGR